MKKLAAYGTLTALLAFTLAGVASAQTTSNTSNMSNTNSVYNGATDNSSTGDGVTGNTSNTSNVSGNTSGTSTGTTTPGLPDTGAGGNAGLNTALLAGAGIIALGGAAYLARRAYQ